MQITIKTYDEVSAERVTIEVAPGQRAEVTVDGETSGRLFTEAEVINAQASEGKLIGEAYRASITRLETELADERRRSHLYDVDRTTERDRADKLKAQLAEVTSQRDSQHSPGGVWDRLHKRTAEVEKLKVELASMTTSLNLIQGQIEQFRVTTIQMATRHQREINRLTHEAASASLALRVQAALEILSTEEVDQDIEAARGPLSVRLIEAIRAARIALGGTSQA